MDENVLRRVLGLLDKADSTEFEAEAEALRERAERLILTYGIERAMLAAKGEVTDEVTTIEIKFEDPFSNQKADLLHFIADALNCKAIGHRPVDSRGRTVRGSKKMAKAVVVGYASDLEQVELLYTSLLLQSARKVALVQGLSAGDTRSLRSSFLYGFSVRAGERLTELYRRTTREVGGTGAALVLVDREAKVDAAVRQLAPRMSTSRRRYYPDPYEAGVAAANSADMGQSRFGGGARKELAAGS